jgi:CRP/FNR family transcriptional regulator, cyclic AMP receptor protein
VSSPGRTTQSLAQIALLDMDGDLAEAVPHAERLLARRALAASIVAVESGPVDLQRYDLPATAFALLLLKGVLTKDVTFEGRALTEILIAGDVLLPWEPEVDGLAVNRRITATNPARLAVLDHRFLRAAARWPMLMLDVQRRLSDQEHRVAVHGAICQLSRVEERIVSVLRHVAARIGHVGPQGTTVPLPLTHEALGKLVGAQRSTVTLALKELASTGLVRRRADGTWLLQHTTLISEPTADAA